MTMKLFGRTLPAVSGPLAPRLATALREAEARLTALGERRGALALSVALGEAEADAEMQAFHAETEALRREVADLTAAHGAALAKDAAVSQAKNLAAQASKVNSLRQRLGLREKAALRLQAAIVNCVVEYEAILEINRGLFTLLSADGHLPVDTLAPSMAWRGAVAAELLRVGHGPQIDGNHPYRFPGGAALDFDSQNAPERIAPLAERVKAGSAMLLGLLGAAPTPTPPTATAAAAPVPVADVALAGAAAEPDPALQPSEAVPDDADNLALAG
jgi:hypothetical protein